MRTLILGVTGQDGSFLAEKAVARGDDVHGVVRRSSQFNRDRIEPLLASNPGRVNLHYADLIDTPTLRRIFQRVQPEEVYHLAGQSHVGLSFEIPESTFHEVAMSTLSLLEICRDLDHKPRVYLAGSSELFGRASNVPQTEETPFRPVSPYGCAKACVVQLAGVYREAYGLFIACGILYNHESVRRGLNFVTRKITSSVAKFVRNPEDNEVLELGNLDSERDWGYAPEYVDGMMRMLSQSDPDDYVLATGSITTVREFTRHAFAAGGMKLIFEGKGQNEVGRLDSTGRVVLRVNSRYFRPTEPCLLVGDATKAQDELGWIAETKGVDVAKKMVQEELKDGAET